MASVTVRARKAGEAYGHAPVRVWLSDGDGAEVVGYVDGVIVAALEKPADAGGVAVFDLPLNSTVSPGNTCYSGSVGGVSIGVIQVDGAGAWEDLLVSTPGDLGSLATLDSLADVNVPDPDDNDRLAWDEGTGRWVAAPPADASAEIETAIDAHEAESDPHPTYTTAAEAAAAGSAAVVTHVGLADPHTQYQKESEKGGAGGYAELDGTGKVPAAQLPSFVDDVVEAANFAALPVTGEAGKIYVTLDDNKTYRWGGSAYAEISASLALGETSTTAYRGDRGKTAFDHSQLTSGNPHAVSKTDVGLGNADNTSDANKPVSTATQAALDAKAPKTPTVGTGLGTTGTVDLDLAALDGTVQWIVATGNITFTTSNRAAGRGVRIFIDAGASGRTLAYPAWIAHGSALPTSLASGKRLALTILSLGTTDANISAAAAAQP